MRCWKNTLYFLQQTECSRTTKGYRQRLNTSNPVVIVHLATQAGVHYSLENPRANIDSNIVGTFNVVETAQKFKVANLLMASNSSVYGVNKDALPKEREGRHAPHNLSCDQQSHWENRRIICLYDYLPNIPTMTLRFSTVYGPSGRRDMALYKSIAAILHGRKTDIYNKDEMYSDHA